MHKKKNILIQNIIIPILMAITTLTVEAQSMSQIDIATKYYQALYSGEYETVRSLASPDMMFEDPTAPEEYGIPPRLERLEDFIKFSEANLKGEVQINFMDKYVSNDHVVLRVEIKGTYPADVVGMGEDGLAEVIGQGISVLHVVDGKVISHSDYMDYAGAVASMLTD